MATLSLNDNYVTLGDYYVIESGNYVVLSYFLPLYDLFK